ncbi:MAG: 16S rRNA (uracil(1498)-N(3))-methyltransferase [Firmicutes bacterium]|nr:16S rRNA (uracil(1498)-N(3))-methyltransferase [Bacillota bacterium]
MPKFFVKNDQINGNEISIVGEDVNHIVNVLRLKEEDEINICNTDTSENYIAKIVGAPAHRCPNFASGIKCEIVNKIDSKAESNIHITIFQGLPKADKMELVIEKCIELGAAEITPVEMKRCVVKLEHKTKIKKIERWQKTAETAAKQSGRDIIPKVNDIINVKNICNLIDNYDIVLLAYEEEKENTLKEELQNFAGMNIGIIIGPEGGLEPEEVSMLKEKRSKSCYIRKQNIKN